MYYYVIRWVNSVVFYVMVDVKKGMKVKIYPTQEQKDMFHRNFAVARPIMSFLTNTIKCTVKIPT